MNKSGQTEVPAARTCVTSSLGVTHVSPPAVKLQNTRKASRAQPWLGSTQYSPVGGGRNMEVRVMEVSCSKRPLSLQTSLLCSAPVPQPDPQPSLPLLFHSVHPEHLAALPISG